MSRGISTVNPGLSIPELINIVKQSFRESEFDEVRNILMDREEKMKIENENIRMDHELVKKEVRLLEESQKLAESEKQILEENLRKIRMKLNDTISSLETRVGKMEKMEKEFEVLRREREELKRENDELRRKNVESDEKAERYKIRIENLEPRIMKVEGALADALNVKVEDLAPLANSMDKSDGATATAKGGNVDIDSDKASQGLGNKNATETELQRCRRTDGKGWQCKRGALPNQKHCERHMRRRAKKLVLNTQSGNSSLPHLDNGDSSTKDDGANTAQTSPGSQSSGSPPRVEPQVPVKVIGAQAGDVIEIIDTDDESNCDDKFDSDTFLTKRIKRSRIYISDEEDDSIAIDGKENQDPESSHDRITPLNGFPFDDSQTHHDISTDSDDDSSCSDGHINNLVATFQSKKFGCT